jgi:hypothetical protein
LISHGSCAETRPELSTIATPEGAYALVRLTLAFAFVGAVGSLLLFTSASLPP